MLLDNELLSWNPDWGRSRELRETPIYFDSRFVLSMPREPPSCLDPLELLSHHRLGALPLDSISSRPVSMLMLAIGDKAGT